MTTKTKTQKTDKPKRHKEVYPTDEIPHLWMVKSQPSARNPQGNLFFRDSTIFSYGDHFPIARHVETAKGSCVFITTRTWPGNTTAGHVSAVYRAIPQDTWTFRVDDVFSKPADAAKELAQNVKDAADALKTAKSAPSRAVKYTSLLKVAADANRFNEYFGYKARYDYRTPELDTILAEHEAKVQRQRGMAQVKAQEKRDKYNVEYEERRRLESLGIDEKIAAWRAGGYVNLPYGTPTMLRLSKKGDEVETSQGARVPVRHARLLLAIVRRTIASGVEWVSNGKTIHIGHYTVDRIDVAGNLHAGCHHIDWDEISRFAEVLDVLPVPAFRSEPIEVETTTGH